MTRTNPTSFPILRTDRLTLRQLSIEDLHDVFTLRSDSKINKFLDRQLCLSYEDALKFIEKINANIENSALYYWAITLSNTKTFVGTICLFGFSHENTSCEIGYELLAKFQGQGIMNEAVQLVSGYAFKNLKRKKIFAFTHQENHDSTNLLLKLNFVESIPTDKENINLKVFTLTPK